MTEESSVLVVANVTATSRELIDSLNERTAKGSCRFTLLIPHKSEGSAEAIRERLDEALSRMREAGLQVDDGRIADPDPVSAVGELWDPEKFDEIVISTLPKGRSKWLESDVPRRVKELTSAPVTHVEATGSGWATFDR
jgi:hypothetical protein